MNSRPDYQKIYSDLISRKFPEKKELCSHLLKKKIFCTLDVIKIERIICSFRDETKFVFDQKHKSYDEQTILEILNFGKVNGLSNIRLAEHFLLSRNTIMKWKKIYKV